MHLMLGQVDDGGAEMTYKINNIEISGRPNPLAGFTIEDVLGVDTVAFLGAKERRIILASENDDNVLAQVIVMTTKQEYLADIIEEILWRVSQAGMIIKPLKSVINAPEAKEKAYPGPPSVVDMEDVKATWKQMRDDKEAAA